MVKLDINTKAELEEDKFTELGTIKDPEPLPEVPPELTDENITQEQINEMKMLGMDKPPLVSWDRWQRIQDVRHAHEHMILMAASGMGPKVIAEQLGYDYGHVAKILRVPEVKEKVSKTIADIYGTDIKKALKDRNLKAIAVVDDVLTEGKENERAAMAKWVLEHTIGKASQDIQVTKTTLIEFIHKADSIKENQLRDVNQIAESLPKVKDHFDTIIEQVIPQGMVVGKRSGGESEK